MSHREIPFHEPSPEILKKQKQFNVKYKGVAAIYLDKFIPSGGSLVFDLIKTKNFESLQQNKVISLKRSEKEIMEWINTLEKEIDKVLKQTEKMEQEVSSEDKEDLASIVKDINAAFKDNGAKKSIITNFDEGITIFVYEEDDYNNPETKVFNSRAEAINFLNWISLCEDPLFSKEQWIQIREKVTNINSTFSTGDSLVPSVSENGDLILSTNLSGYEDEIVCTSFEQTIKVLDAFLKDNKRFLESVKDKESEVPKGSEVVIRKEIAAVVDLLNSWYKGKIVYNYLLSDQLEILLIQDDESIIKFKDLKTFSKWANNKMSKEDIMANEELNSNIYLATKNFNWKNADKNVRLEITLNNNGSISVSFLNALTNKYVIKDVKFLNPQKFIDWATKQNLLENRTI
jgi:hypothetical protein